MGSNVRNAVRTILEVLDLTTAQLAQILGASRQSIYRWRNGEPAEGLHEVVLQGVADALRGADDWTRNAWSQRTKAALEAHGCSLEALVALVAPPPSRDDLAAAWSTLQAGPSFMLQLAPADRKTAATVKNLRFSAGGLVVKRTAQSRPRARKRKPKI